MRKGDPARKGVALVCVCMAAMGCATKSLPEYPILPAERYTLCQRQEGLVMSIEPVLDAEVCKRYFGTNLLKSDILSILVVAKNLDPDRSYLLSGREVAVAASDVETERGQDYDDGTGKAMLGGATAMIAGGIVFTPLLVAAMPVMFVGMKKQSDASVIKHNLALKELRMNTISPGEEVHGFVYFHVPPLPEGVSSLRVQVKAIEMGSSEALEYRFDNIPWKR